MRRIASGLLASWLGIGSSPVEEGAPTGGNVLSCETYSFHRLFERKEMTLEAFPARMKALGIKGISLNDIYFESFDESSLDRVKAAIAASGCIVTAFVIDRNGDFALEDEAIRLSNIEAVRARLASAKKLGAPVVRINVGSTGKGEAADGAVGVDRVIQAIRSLLPTAKDLGLKLCIENHWGVSLRADFVRRIIEGTDPARVGSCLDFKNWPKDADLYAECSKLAPFAIHTHVKAHAFDARGEETGCDYGRVLAMLKSAGYTGALSIEWEGPTDCIEGVSKTRDLIRKHWR